MTARKLTKTVTSCLKYKPLYVSMFFILYISNSLWFLQALWSFIERPWYHFSWGQQTPQRGKSQRPRGWNTRRILSEHKIETAAVLLLAIFFIFFFVKTLWFGLFLEALTYRSDDKWTAQSELCNSWATGSQSVSPGKSTLWERHPSLFSNILCTSLYIYKYIYKNFNLPVEWLPLPGLYYTLVFLAIHQFRVQMNSYNEQIHPRIPTTSRTFPFDGAVCGPSWV